MKIEAKYRIIFDDGTEKEITEEQAKNIMEQLKALLEKKTEWYPVYPYVPPVITPYCPPYYPNWQWSSTPIITSETASNTITLKY